MGLIFNGSTYEYVEDEILELDGVEAVDMPQEPPTLEKSISELKETTEMLIEAVLDLAEVVYND